MGVALAEALDQRLSHALRPAGLGHHLAEHRAQGHHQRNVPQRFADTCLVGAHHTGWRHPRQ
jgi:hypothetical protein